MSPAARVLGSARRLGVVLALLVPLFSRAAHATAAWAFDLPGLGSLALSGDSPAQAVCRYVAGVIRRQAFPGPRVRTGARCVPAAHPGRVRGNQFHAEQMLRSAFSKTMYGTMYQRASADQRASR